MKKENYQEHEEEQGGRAFSLRNTNVKRGPEEQEW